MKKSKSLLVVISIVALTVLSSCKDEMGNTNKSADFYMWVKNAEGKNLLDTATVGHYNEDSIRLYWLKNGQMIEVYRPTYGTPRNFRIFKVLNGEYTMQVYADEGEGKQSQNTTTLIQWDKNDFNNIDTVDTYITKTYSDNSTLINLTKITYDKVVKWDIETYPLYIQWGNDFYPRLIEVVK